MRNYAPDGGYPEGVSYWGYGTLFNVLMISGLESGFGTDYGLGQMPGFMQTGTFAMQMISPLGLQFNFMDNGEAPEESPALFWFYNKTKDPALLCNQIATLKRDSTHKFLNNRVLPAIIIWGAGAPMEQPVLPTQTYWIGNGHTPLCVMRSAWGDPNARFVGVKMGSPSINHGHMDVGSFVFEADSVRWALDLGREDYNDTETLGVDLWTMTQESQRWDVFKYNNFAHNTLTFNDKHQYMKGSAPIIDSSSNPQQPYVATDLTPVYVGQVQKAERAFSLVNNDYLVVEDKVTAGPHYTRMRWTLATKAKPTLISDNIVLLEQDGKKCYLKVDSETPIKWYFEKTPTVNTYDTPCPDVTMVVFDTDLKRNETQKFTVMMLPGSAERSTEGFTPVLK